VTSYNVYKTQQRLCDLTDIMDDLT